jgi:hypothetical protein
VDGGQVGVLEERDKVLQTKISKNVSLKKAAALTASAASWSAMTADDWKRRSV